MFKSLEGPLRAFLAAWLGALVANGVMTEDQMAALTQAIIGLLGIVGVIIWSYLSNQLTSLLSQAAEHRRVKMIVTTPEIAASEESPKIVAVVPGQERNLRDLVVNPSPTEILRPPQ